MAFQLQSLLDLRRNAESEAKGAFDRAMAARVMEEAVEKLKERAEAEEKRQAERQAESAAGDLAQAAHFRKKLE
jgi:flagellar biosynthesis chaperone FliJ